MYHLKKKTLATFMAVSLLALTSCSAESTDGQSSGTGGASSVAVGENSEKITLTLWHYYNSSTKDALDVIISEFNDTVGAEKNISIDAYSHSSVNDLATSLVDSANKVVGMAELPDIFSAYSDTALLLSDMGAVANMDDYFTADELALFQQDFLNEGRFDSEENLKIIPVAKSTELLFINDTDFQIFADATGVKLADLETWEGMAEVAEIYYNWTNDQTPDVENDGRALFGLDSEANFMLVAAKQLGEEMYDYQGEIVSFGFSEEGAQKIWDNLMIPYIKGYYGSLGSYRSDDVKSGDLLIYSGSTSSVYYFPDTVEIGRSETYDIEGTTMAFPYFEGGEKIAVQQGAGMVVSKTDATREAAAAEFLKWFTKAEYNLDFAVSTGYIPVQNDALSLDGVLEVLAENTEGEITNVVESSIYTTYDNMLEEYEFYSNKPFNGSYDTRNVLRYSISDTIAAKSIAYDALISEGVPHDDAIAELISQEQFTQWYADLVTGMEEVFANLAE